MRISRIFPVIEGKLYQVEYEESGVRAFDELRYQWKDTEWLYKFFRQYKKDLDALTEPLKLAGAVKLAMKDANELFENLLDYGGTNLSELFRPLFGREGEIKDNQPQKTRVERPKTWLRIYAVHYDGKYIITGGAIKLTQTMNTRPHLKTELYKLELLRKKLESDISDDSLGYLEL
ncbi:MAG: hypothetical protein RIF36_17080 [Imperialibacter sp.]|uniref:hypothetical protein n=1 Tax=Imperialibacter sp. TaxID=2038411 RepID=UPI0032F003B3